MTGWYDGDRPITIAILAMGGEGGGVLADWIVDLGESGGFIAQNTSVAGVAQRTGATIYYVELYPRERTAPSDSRYREPVLSVFPTPGEVDIVIASELMEAGRAIQRGLSTPDRTALIASTNRVYTMTERMALGDGRVDSRELLLAAHRGSRRLVGGDFMHLAEEAKSVISAALFGALAGSGELPFARGAFEETIRASGKEVERSLAAFAAGFAHAAADPEPVAAPASAPVRVSLTARPERLAERAKVSVGPGLAVQARRVDTDLPAAARDMLLRGCERTAVYQNVAYTDRYLDRVAKVAAVDSDIAGEARLTIEAARHVALWMCYQDTVHVAGQKIRRDRMAGVRQQAKAQDRQLLQVREYLHPQIDEITDSLPAWLGRPLAKSRWFGRIVDRLTGKGMVVNTTSVVGYTMLWTMASLRPMRPRTLRFGYEQESIDAWLELIVTTAEGGDGELAREVVECQNVLKGYGATLAHGRESLATLLDAAVVLAGRPDGAETLARLRQAALADEDGTALRSATVAQERLAK